MTDVTINWFEYLKGKYGKNHPRKTEIRNFDTIEVTKVVEANQKLYINIPKLPEVEGVPMNNVVLELSPHNVVEGLLTLK